MRRILPALLLFAACGPAHYAAPEVMPRPSGDMAVIAPDSTLPVVQLDAAARDFLAWVQSTAQVEWVFCLMGAWDGGRPTVVAVLPTRNHSQTRTRTRYDECPSYVFAAYLGTAHNHVDGPCTFSSVDDASFRADPRAWIEVLTCPGQIVARSKVRRP